MICQACGQSFETLKSLHSHIGKKHEDVESYYHSHFPRYDLLDGSLIGFKNYDQYFNTDFNNKSNLASWCFNNEPEVVQQYIVSQLQKRCSEKRTEFIPSHLELKTLFLPSWHGISSIFGGVEKANEELKKIFKLKYNYASALIFSDTEPEIIVDTREQNPLPFENAKVMKLSCGDYSTAGELYSEVFVERKSLSDFVSTLSGGKDRFKRELDRAKDLDYYIVVVIEDSFHNANNWKPNKNFKQSVNSQYIFYVMRSILSSYDNVQFVFADSRNHAMNLIQKIFQLKENVRNVDLEFAKDFNLI